MNAFILLSYSESAEIGAHKVGASLGFSLTTITWLYPICLQPVEVEFSSAGPVPCLLQSLSVNLRGVWLRQGELHHVGERALLQLVAVQGQELLELTAHIAVLKEEKKEKSVDLFKEKYKEFHQKLDFKRKGVFFMVAAFFST